MKGKKHRNYRDLMEDDEGLSIREIKEMRNKKRYRNFDNALRSKNLDAIINCTSDWDDDEDDYEEQYNVR